MDPQTAPASPKALYAVIGVLLGVIIVGAATWLYLSNKPAPVVTTTTPVTATKTPTTTETNTAAATASTTIANALTELDTNLTVMKADQDSDDDTISL